MTYRRVIPRDLFNDADLLKCVGQFVLNTESFPSVHIEQGNIYSFIIEQDENDGWTYMPDLIVGVRGLLYFFTRPMNSREKYPLYIHRSEDGQENEPIRVLKADGSLTEEFIKLATGEVY